MFYLKVILKIILKRTPTSWNMPVLNEFYVNFGKRGLCLECFNWVSVWLYKIFSFQNLKNIEAVFTFF